MINQQKRELQPTVEDDVEEYKSPPNPPPSEATQHRGQPLPPPLNLSSVARALADADSPATGSSGSPIRYAISASSKRSKTSSAIAESGTPASAVSNASVPVVHVADILLYDIRARAVYWMNRALLFDPTTMVLSWDIYAAYGYAFLPHGEKVEMLTCDELVELILKMFKGTIRYAMNQDSSFNTIRNLAWKRQPHADQAAAHWKQQMATRKLTTEEVARRMIGDGTPLAPANKPTFDTAMNAETMFSEGNEYDDFVPIPFQYSTKVLKLGQKLIHVIEPTRTKMWVRMLFERGQNEEIEESAIWSLYERTFSGCSIPYLDDVQLIDVIRKVYPQVEEAEVAPETRVLYNLKPRVKPLKLGPLLHRYRTLRQSRRLAADHEAIQDMENRGELVIRVEPWERINDFQSYLLDEPLLSLPLDGAVPSPWTRRLRDRNYANQGQQPGFSGISVADLDKLVLLKGRRNRQRAEMIANAAGLPLSSFVNVNGTRKRPTKATTTAKAEGNFAGPSLTAAQPLESRDELTPTDWELQVDAAIKATNAAKERWEQASAELQEAQARAQAQGDNLS